MRRADRLFQIVQLLRLKKTATARELASELEVHPRTLYRDIQDLVASGVPIEGEAGVGYRLARGYELPPLTLYGEELESLVIGMRMVQRWADPALGEAAGRVLRKVEAVLPAGLRPQMQATNLFAPDLFATHPSATRFLRELREAIAGHRKLRIAYRAWEYSDKGGEETERTVRPLALYFWGSRWTLAAWCELRGDYRSFRPDRIQKLETLSLEFDGSDGVHLQGFIGEMERRPQPGPAPF